MKIRQITTSKPGIKASTLGPAAGTWRPRWRSPCRKFRLACPLFSPAAVPQYRKRCLQTACVSSDACKKERARIVQPLIALVRVGRWSGFHPFKEPRCFAAWSRFTHSTQDFIRLRRGRFGRYAQLAVGLLIAWSGSLTLTLTLTLTQPLRVRAIVPVRWLSDTKTNSWTTIRYLDHFLLGFSRRTPGWCFLCRCCCRCGPIFQKSVAFERHASDT